MHPKISRQPMSSPAALGCTVASGSDCYVCVDMTSSIPPDRMPSHSCSRRYFPGWGQASGVACHQWREHHGMGPKSRSGLYGEVDAERTSKSLGLITSGIRFPDLTAPSTTWVSHKKRFLFSWDAVNATGRVWQYAAYFKPDFRKLLMNCRWNSMNRIMSGATTINTPAVICP